MLSLEVVSRMFRLRPAWLLLPLLLVLPVVAMGSVARPARSAPEMETAETAARKERIARYGVGVNDGEPAQVTALGLEWFVWGGALKWALGTGLQHVKIPEEARFPIIIPTKKLLSQPEIQTLAKKRPGTYYLVENEPNVASMGDTSPEAYAAALKYYDEAFAKADPTAKLVGPNVLNWEHLCNGCGGYDQGRAWTERMRETYLARYGAEPPLDIWSLHAYDIDWDNLPQGDASRQIAQIQGMRDWLDSVGLAARPMWITEAGIHWGYPEVRWKDDKAFPGGEFATDHVAQYMRDLFGWLEANHESARIDKWFLWVISWTDDFEWWQGEWTGIELMDGRGPDAPVTPFGRLYQQMAGIEPE